MASAELEKAFGTLADALTLTESEIGEEINVITQQIEQLKERINLLNGRQQELAHDRSSLEEMFKRYCDDNEGVTEI